MESKGIEWALTAPVIDVGKFCVNAEVPIMWAEEPYVAACSKLLLEIAFLVPKGTDVNKALGNELLEVVREAHKEGYRHALSDAREYFEKKQHPLLQCVDCKNTESTAGAMARAFNQGRCVHCGGYFKVVKA